MRRLSAQLSALLSVLGVAMLLALPAIAQSAGPLPPGVSPLDRDAIRSVITHQLDAFRHDDGPGAYQDAAPAIQKLFPTPDGFLGMVRRAYPPVYRAQDNQFTELVQEEGQLVQHVELVGPDGRAVTALYSMVRDPAGHWRIVGCALVPSRRVST